MHTTTHHLPNVIPFSVSQGEDKTSAEVSEGGSPRPLNLIDFPVSDRIDASYSLLHEAIAINRLSKSAVLQFGMRCIAGEGEIVRWKVMHKGQVWPLSRFVFEDAFAETELR